ncbi:hypothetical protein ABZ260_39085 [Streptosporangium sp. NPDC006013]|uniref:hypothetical protein n=1 Tax=Streptosporangium sp. NPDC006013 TaxID=3155596 RepID=UPI0033AA7B63
MVLPGLSREPIVFGGYTVYDYVLHARVGRTLGKKALKIRLVPQACVASAAARVMKRAALHPGVLPAADILAMNPPAVISGSVTRRCSSRWEGSPTRSFAPPRPVAQRPESGRALVFPKATMIT